MGAVSLTAAQIQMLNTGLQVGFADGLAEPNDAYKEVSFEVPSSAAANTYAWLSQFPRFSEFTGARVHKTLAKRAWAVSNRLFTNTVDIQRTEIEDDTAGMYSSIAKMWGVSVKDLYNELVFGLLNNGFTSLCYDQQYFFSAAHPLYPNEDGTGVASLVSNVAPGAGETWVLLCTKKSAPPVLLQQRTKPELVFMGDISNPVISNSEIFSWGGRWRGEATYGFWQCAYGAKVAFTEAAFETAFNTILRSKGDGNRVLNLVPDTLIVGPLNRSAAEKVILAQNKAGGESNTYYNRVKLIVSPFMQ